MISLLRCDDRLIHGQCMASVVKQYRIKDIIVVDDYTASSPIMKKIFQTVVSKGINAYPLTIEEAPAKIQAATTNSASTLVLTRLPSTMHTMFVQIPDLVKDLNVANVAAKEGTIHVTGYARCDQNEIDALKAMADMGIHIWFNTILGQPVTEWESIRSKY